MTAKKRYWISWVQTSEDYRPLTYPPNAAVLGWWCSGTNHDGAILCAVVAADSKQEAVSAVLIDWPEINGDFLRFCDEYASDFKPADRFVIKDWMKERFQ
jgi:hypothetical protein